MGFYLGKFIYLMDAYDDIGEDIRKGRFNVFAPFYGREDFDARCGSVLKMMIAECSEQFERLPVCRRLVEVRGGGTEENITEKKGRNRIR